MRDGARRAIFGPVGEEGEVTSASVSERIKRAKAEEAIKLIFLHALMARKILARFIGEEFMAHPASLLELEAIIFLNAILLLVLFGAAFFIRREVTEVVAEREVDCAPAETEL